MFKQLRYVTQTPLMPINSDIQVWFSSHKFYDAGKNYVTIYKPSSYEGDKGYFDIYMIVE